MFKEFLGKRVILFVNAHAHIHYVGTLTHAHGYLIKLVDVTPFREERKMPDMVANMSCPKFSELALVTDSERDDPSRTKTK
jgi:hypothetical protein